MGPLILRLAYTVLVTALQSLKGHNHEVREFPSCNASLPTRGYPSESLSNKLRGETFPLLVSSPRTSSVLLSES